MSSDVEDTGTDGHAAACEASKDVRAQRLCSSRLVMAALAVALAMSLLRASAAQVDPPTAQPTPFQIPEYWGDLPQPTALVHLKTSIGMFTLPKGYLADPYVIKDRPIITASDGARLLSGNLVFTFEYPSGGMNANPQGMTTVYDSTGHAVPGRTVVFVKKVGPPNENREDFGARILNTYMPGSLVRTKYDAKFDDENLDGVASGSGPGHRIGVDLSCQGNCIFTLYLEHQRVILDGLFDGHFRHDGLAIAEQAQRLFENWQTISA